MCHRLYIEFGKKIEKGIVTKNKNKKNRGEFYWIRFMLRLD